MGENSIKIHLNPRNNWVHFLNFFILGGPVGIWIKIHLNPKTRMMVPQDAGAGATPANNRLANIP